MDEEKEYVYVDVYADSTRLFTESFCDYTSNVITIRLEKKLVFEYFQDYVEKDFKEKDDIEDGLGDEELFEKWLTEYYTCDDADGLYSWCGKRNAEVLIQAV